MKLLVLGSEGQIGGHLCSFLEKKGHEVDRLDIVLTPNDDLRYRVNSDAIYERMYEADYVFFLAFDVGGSSYLKKYEGSPSFILSNLALMHETFQSLQDSKTPFMFASSQMADMPYSSYGTLKRAGEFLTKALDQTTVRFWNVYGIEKDIEKAHVITDFINEAISTKKIECKTSGYEERQFLYADDACEAMYTLMEKKLKGSFDISSFKWTRIIDIAMLIGDKMEVMVLANPDVGDEVQKDAKVDPKEDILEHWVPKVKLEVGINRIIKEYKSWI